MTQLTRNDVLDVLQQQWGTYIARFQEKTPGEQQLFLEKQGYARLNDLVAHVVAWWKDSIPHLIRFMEDPDAVAPDYNIDDFNARAVTRFHTIDEAEMIRLFEDTRDEMIGLVESIPEWAFDDPNVSRRLYAETIGHYQEHAFEND